MLIYKYVLKKHSHTYSEKKYVVKRKRYTDITMSKGKWSANPRLRMPDRSLYKYIAKYLSIGTKCAVSFAYPV